MQIITIVYALVHALVVADCKKCPLFYPPKQWLLKMKKGKHPFSGHFLVCQFWATLEMWR